MLAEFIISPDIFAADDAVLRVWLNELREILLPRGGIPKFVICKLGNEKWQKAVEKRIFAIRNPELRSNAKTLFERIITEIGVGRPLMTSETPVSEDDWISAGVESSSRIALDGILALKTNLIDELVLSIPKFSSEEYCERFSNPRFVPRTENAQIASLRTICLHSDWMILRLPQIRGGIDDEIVTLKQVLQLASKRFPEQKKCTVEIHICRQENIPDERLKNNIEDEIAVFGEDFVELDIRMFPRKAFTDRQIVAGDWALMGGDNRVRRARWLVTMSHVAIGKKRESTSEPCTWSLFDRKAAHARLKEISAT